MWRSVCVALICVALSLCVVSAWNGVMDDQFLSTIEHSLLPLRTGRKKAVSVVNVKKSLFSGSLLR